jgi:ABC-type phosphate/phosphonate transport system substrate-binding protein
MPLAILPMYDLESLRPSTDALWSAIAANLRAAGIEAPSSLARAVALEDAWADPALLLGQTCGYPLVTSLRGRVTLLATPRYRAPGCEGAAYRSAVVVRAHDPAHSLADLRGARCAVNGLDSNSGMNVLRAAIAPLVSAGDRFFADVVVTGAHAASLAALAGGRADVAAIDCVTWAHLQRLRPGLTAGLRVLAWSVAMPGLPLITSLRSGEAVTTALRAALWAVGADPALAPVREALLLEGFDEVPLQAYDAILALQAEAVALGYPALR